MKHRNASRRVHAWLAAPFRVELGAALLWCVALASPGAAQSVAPPELTEEFARVAMERARFTRFVAELDRLPLEGFQEAGRAFLGVETEPSSREERLEALIHVAGRALPLGLSAAREAERRAHRDAARALLAECLAPGDGAEPSAALAVLERCLERPGAAEGGSLGPEGSADLRACSARLAGALARYDLAPRVAGLLDVSADPVTTSAARRALHALYGRWFSGRAAFQALWPRLEGKTAADLFVDELIERERTSQARLLALLAAKPLDVLDDAFAEPDPTFRARVCALVAASVGAGGLAPERAFARLCEQLTLEVAPETAHAVLAALLELLQGAPAEDARFAELRAALAKMEARGIPALDDVALRALPRLPAHEPNGAASAEAARVAAADLALASSLLAGLIDGLRPLDPDLVVQQLAAYGTVARRVSDTAQRRSLANGVADRLRAIVEGRDGASSRARVAAADALAAVLTPADVAVLLDIVRSLDEPNVRYRLLGVLADAAPLVTDASARERIAGVLLSAAESPEPAVRARALELLDDARLATAIAAMRAEGPQFDRRLIEVLRGPGNDAERVAVLEVLATSKRSALLADVLRADTLRPLATGAPAVLLALTSTIVALAGDDTESLWRAADLLTLELPGTEEAERPSRPRRLAAALEIVLGLSPEAAAAASPERHAAVVAWFLELRARSTQPGEPVLALDEADRKRLAGVHAKAHEAAVPGAEGPKYVRAIMAVDGLGDASTAEDRERALRALDVALDASKADPGRAQVHVLRLDRARIADALSRKAEAERDLLAVFEAAPNLLIGRDLRRLAALATEGARHETCVRALECLVQRPIWRTRSTESRLADLDELVTAAAATRDAATLARVRGLFAGIPAPPPAGADGGAVAVTEPPADPLPAWTGLVAAGRTEHERLVAIARRLDAPPPPQGDAGAPAAPAGGQPARTPVNGEGAGVRR